MRPISQPEQAAVLDRVVAPGQRAARLPHRVRDGVIQVCLPDAG